MVILHTGSHKWESLLSLLCRFHRDPILVSCAGSSGEGEAGLSLDDVKQAWLTVPKPKRSSGIKHQDAVLEHLLSHHTANVEAQEAKLKGSTMIRINLVRELLLLSKALSSPVDIETVDMGAASEPSREESLPLASSSSFASAMQSPGPISPAHRVSDPARRSLDSLSSCSNLLETKAVFRSPSLEAASTRLLVLMNLGFIEEARLLELHGILQGGGDNGQGVCG